MIYIIYCQYGLEYSYGEMHREGGCRMPEKKSETGKGDIMGQVSTQKDMVNYQAGSVVSRTIIDKTAGTITLFAFAEGQGLSEHTAPYDALVSIIDGEADITISGKALHLKEGQMTVMPANEPHALQAMKRFKMMLVMIKA
jgi:quercetin dioxygenase-like cupin family protein